MKEIVKVFSDNEKLKPKDLLTAAFSHFLVALCGFIAARGIVLDKLLPFGLSFIAGSSLTYTPACAIGVFLGYFIPAVGNGAFRYLASLFAVLSIKLLLSNYKKLVGNGIFLSFITFLSLLLTSAAAIKISGGNMLYAFAEATVSAVGTYFTSKCYKIISKTVVGLTPDDMTAVLIVTNALLLGLENFQLAGVSLGGISCVLLILCASKYGGVMAGAISGITVAFTRFLGGGSSVVGITFAAIGLFCGVFSPLGKYAQVFVLMILTFIGAIAAGDLLLVPAIVTQSVLGSIFFLVFPRSAGIYLSKIFSSYPKVISNEGIKKSLVMRLSMASNALKDVSKTVDQVSSQLSKINTPDYSSVIQAIERDACSGCKLRVHCWEKKREETINAVLQMTKAVKQGDLTPENTIDNEFKDRCKRISGMANSVYRRYSEYASKIAAENRIDEVRSVVSDQFEGISSMLLDVARDFELQDRYDNSAAENVASALKNLNINVDECTCRIDKFGRMTIEAKLKKVPELVINKAQVMRVVSWACERNFDVPSVSEVGGEIYVTIREKTELTVDFGVAQSCADNNSMCGDAYKSFKDNSGHFVMVLSDGMGTGGRAAVDGAMASGLMARLLKSGFGYNCSLKILNSSMLFKSTDESTATIDIASIDLYNGTLELYKAGAAPTIVRRNGKTGKAESNSLPIGILRDVGLDKAAIKCKDGDVIALLSDGATCEGTDWIRAEIEAWREGTAQDLAERLCLCARRRQIQKKQDDITVMCAILEKTI